jgi:prepilin signal peptidase PulO-like enzyme (type II secretory pathway)
VPLSAIDSKRCPGCGAIKRLVEFRGQRGTGVIGGYCRSCRSAYNRKYFLAHPEARNGRSDDA